MKLRRTKAVEKELDFIVTLRNVIFKKVMFWGIAKKVGTYLRNEL